MTHVLPVAPPDELRLVALAPAVRGLTPSSAERHPALVYLASLAPGSRRTMRQSLDVVAALLTSGRADHVTLAWHLLRYQHTTAVRAALAEQYKPATANKILAGLRGTLKTAWRLELVDAEAYAPSATRPICSTFPTCASAEQLTPSPAASAPSSRWTQREVVEHAIAKWVALPPPL